jgi:anti-anti-sigma factor
MTDTRVFSVPARVDGASAAAFEGELMEAAGDGARPLVLDFSATDYMSSAGLRVVLLAAKRQKSGGGRLVLAGMKPTIHEIFRVSGFSKILEIVGDVAAARTAIG